MVKLPVPRLPVSTEHEAAQDGGFPAQSWLREGTFLYFIEEEQEGDNWEDNPSPS